MQLFQSEHYHSIALRDGSSPVLVHFTEIVVFLRVAGKGIEQIRHIYALRTLLQLQARAWA